MKNNTLANDTSKNDTPINCASKKHTRRLYFDSILNAAPPHPLQTLSGVGPRLAARLARIGIRHPRELLFHLPLRYQDRTRAFPIGELQPGREAVVVAQVDVADVRYARRRSLLVNIYDQSGQMTLRFFHFSAAQLRGFQADAWISCYGEVRTGYDGLEMVHPEYRLHKQRPMDATEATLTPIYPSTEGVSTGLIRKLVQQGIAQELDGLEECLPLEIREKFNLMPLREALQSVHNPSPQADTIALLAGTDHAQQRLALEELLAHHLALSRVRAKHKTRNAPPFNSDRGSWAKLKTNLGFALTSAQQRVIAEILADLNTPTPTMRLVQGDVGSGKTVVAAAAALAAIDAGYQVALMAPTELLSEQHQNTFGNWFAPLGIEIEWLAGRMPAAARAKSLHRIVSGEAKMIIGTHALFQQSVVFHRLGLMIIDEQHRFGVDQRLALRNKAVSTGDEVGSETNRAANSHANSHANSPPNRNSGYAVPHQIIMSATPIPRSLAMIFYADLDVSTIDEQPPGRKPVHTVVLPNSRRDEVAARIRGICRNHNQAYWVCPLIDESDKLQAQAAVVAHEKLGKLLPEVSIELIHGRMKSADKEAVMRRFHRGEIDLLVATTVIEVGVDVPSASLMIIENAERLGLAQLHQLRGRVGRGSAQATCVLMYQPPLGQSAKQRLGILRDTNDGFVIANKDLEQRGAGDVLGTRQTGLQQMKVADLARDRALLPAIEQIARLLMARHPRVVDALIERWISLRESYAEV